MSIWLARLGRFAIILLSVATFVGFFGADQWWIRVFDFPRLQMAMLLGIAMTTIGIARSKHLPLYLGIGAISLGFHLYQLVPYSPLAPKQVVTAAQCAQDDRLHLAVFNVLQSNRDFDRTLAWVTQQQPDIFLAMENDQQWTKALQRGLDEDYPYSAVIPQDNTYGMGLWSKLKLVQIERNELAGGGTPSIKARVIKPDGTFFTLFAVHPRPPKPGQDSGQRDAELVLLADKVRESGRPTVVMGDFNDVPWSSVTETFQRIGQLLDPRVGRGFHASFDAQNPLMRWPLDHVLHTDDFGLLDFGTGPDLGSDHFPLIAQLCQKPGTFAPLQDAPALTSEAIEDAVTELEDAAEGGAGFDADELSVKP